MDVLFTYLRPSVRQIDKAIRIKKGKTEEMK